HADTACGDFRFRRSIPPLVSATLHPGASDARPWPAAATNRCRGDPVRAWLSKALRWPGKATASAPRKNDGTQLPGRRGAERARLRRGTRKDGRTQSRGRRDRIRSCRARRRSSAGCRPLHPARGPGGGVQYGGRHLQGALEKRLLWTGRLRVFLAARHGRAQPRPDGPGSPLARPPDEEVGDDPARMRSLRWPALVVAFILLLYGTVMVFLAFDRVSHSNSDTIRPFIITMAPVWAVAIAAAIVLLLRPGTRWSRSV